MRRAQPPHPRAPPDRAGQGAGLALGVARRTGRALVQCLGGAPTSPATCPLPTCSAAIRAALGTNVSQAARDAGMSVPQFLREVDTDKDFGFE